ncbi:MAG: hypothetical protein JNM56_33795 [Planctomycetia bacterium]|nr:hypothetical protein [Planctomycetia bacterium]
MSDRRSHGKTMWDRLNATLRQLRCGSTSTRSRQIIWGVTPQGHCVGGMTVDGFLAQVAKILVDSRRVYRWGNSILYEVAGGDGSWLLPLANEYKAETAAASRLATLFCVGVQHAEQQTEALPPANLVGALLADPALGSGLPTIQYYSRRPVFDVDFQLCHPGWNAASGILVHDAETEPVLPTPGTAQAATVLDRLPPCLRHLLAGFCWHSDADLVNCVGLCLTGLLVNHFVEAPHPVAIVDGNQRGLGKTLLIQALGRLLDGVEPPRIKLTGDEELEKKLCAHVREARSSLILLDNVRGHIDSALIEQNALSPVLNFRILGQSATVSRPNSFLWAITSNNMSATEDLVNRGLPIRLHFEGDPRRRDFGADVLDYATRHRRELLGELAGMVLHWQQQARPHGTHRHRCQQWARLIGGILEANGLGEYFLANLAEAEASMDEGLQALATLAELLLAQKRAEFVQVAEEGLHGTGKPPADWATVFVEADLYREQLGPKSARARATWAGQFLGAKVDRLVTVTVADRTATATLRKRELRARKNVYYFEIVWTVEPDAPSHPTSETSDRSGAGWPASPEPSTTPKAAPVKDESAESAPAAQKPDVKAADSARPGETSGNDLPWD